MSEKDRVKKVTKKKKKKKKKSEEPERVLWRPFSPFSLP